MTGMVLRGPTVIDGVEPLTAEVADVRIEDGRIAEVGRGLLAPDTPTFDVAGLTLLPGLIDCHTHLVLDGAPHGALPASEPLAKTALRAAANAARTVASGITTVRDLGGRHGVEFELRAAVDTGELIGPRMLLAGQILAFTSSVGGALSGMFREADDPSALRKAAREQLKAGADVLKVMASGTVMGREQDPGAPHFQADEIRVVVGEAGREHRRVATHAHGARAARNAIVAGVRSIEHGTFLCDDERILEEMRARGVFMVPTLSFLHWMVENEAEGEVPAFMLEHARSARDRHFETFRRALELGVQIAFGTDSGSPYCLHGRNAEELELWVELRMWPARAVAAATSSAAGCLGLEHEIGTLQVGKAADMLVVEGNPLLDIRSLRRVWAVIRFGRFVEGAPSAVLSGARVDGRSQTPVAVAH